LLKRKPSWFLFAFDGRKLPGTGTLRIPPEREEIIMPENTVYLEASDRTQDLLNLKWTLRSAGYAIGSTWHEGEAFTSLLAFGDHWDARSMEQLQICDRLIVICRNGDRGTPELAMMAGFALGRGLEVIWIGSPVRGMVDFRAVKQFNTAEDFEKQILQRPRSRPTLPQERLAA